MDKNELRLKALEISLNMGKTDGIDMVLKEAEKIYSFLTKDGVEDEKNKDNSTSTCQKVFR